jgi:hypothetical protein
MRPATSSTRSRTPGLTVAVLFSTRETVATDTSAARATSRMVGTSDLLKTLFPPPCNGAENGCNRIFTPIKDIPRFLHVFVYRSENDFQNVS